MSYARLSTAFREHHQHPLNLALHLLTTPLGVLMTLRLCASAHPFLGLAVAGAYLATLPFFVPAATWLRSAALLAPITWLSLQLQIGPGLTLALLVAAWFGQDLAHAIVRERTLQSAYDETASWLRQFAEHTYFLLPLCVDAAVQPAFATTLLSWCMPRSGLLTTRLVNELPDLRLVRDWVVQQQVPEDTTTHWWAGQLDEPVREAVERVVSSPAIEAMFRERHGAGAFAVEPVRGMNEVYVASRARQSNSDAVFYTRHIDGPFMLYPFAAVYRCIVAVNENAQFRTVFPMTPASAIWTSGDVGGFDFNREPHYIESTGAANAGPRITLKLHYCVYPRFLPAYGKLLAWLNVRYDEAARKAFLKSLRPASLFERMLARTILITTETYGFLGKHIGGANLAWLGFLAALNAVTSAPVFLIGTSFIHYFLYIGTYYQRDGVSFHTFRRNAMLYKGLAVAQLAIIYARHFEFDPLSLALITAGLLLSALAARRLGWERTYFGSELGLSPPARSSQFPYGWLPHPMILGNVIALCGLMKMAAFRHAFPWLAPLHIGFYLVHLFQEELDLHLKTS